MLSGIPNHVQLLNLDSFNLNFPVTHMLTSPCDGSNGPEIVLQKHLHFFPILGIRSKL